MTKEPNKLCGKCNKPKGKGEGFCNCGRPEKYTKKLGELICLRLTNGESLKKICEDSKMPSRISVHAWLLDEEKKEFLNNYKTAINIRTENMFDDIEDIAENDGEVQRDRLRVDTRKWYLSKVMPKKYGDKLDLTSGGEKLPTPIYGGKSTDKEE